MAYGRSSESPSSIVVVTGVPGSGKTTLASALAIAFEVPLLSLDAMKEHLYDGGVGTKDPYGLRLAAEAELVAQLSATAGTVVVDIWIAPRRDTERVTALLEQQGKDIVELICRVPADIAVSRYAGRQRFVPHLPPDAPTLQRIRDAVDVLEPMGIGTGIELDTSRPLDIGEVLDHLRRITMPGGGRSREPSPHCRCTSD